MTSTTSVKVNHFNLKPVNGGTPAKEHIVISKKGEQGPKSLEYLKLEVITLLMRSKVL